MSADMAPMGWSGSRPSWREELKIWGLESGQSKRKWGYWDGNLISALEKKKRALWPINNWRRAYFRKL